MRLPIAALILALPFAAHAQPIPEAELRVSFDECVRSCEPARGFSFCADMCGCMTHQVSRHWTIEDFVAHTDRIWADPDDPEMKDEIDRIARYCARRIE